MLTSTKQYKYYNKEMSDYCTTKYDARQSNIVSWFTSVLFFLYANDFMTGIKEINA